ncbi:MAG TPA: hypothetical protein VGF75_06660, partial [Candidatus Saccharimonadales bacterium]
MSNSVYDEDSDQRENPSLGKTKTGSDLHKLEGSAKDDTHSSSSESQQEKSLNSSQLGSAENSSSTAGRSLYNPSPEKGGFRSGGVKKIFWGSRKRKLATSGTGLTGGIVGILVALVFTAAGPAQLVQLSTTLQKNFEGMDNASTSTLNNEFSYFQGAPQDLAATRLDNLAQLTLRPIFNQLNGSGVTFQLNGTYGLKGITIDPAKLATQNSDFAAAEDQKTWLADAFNIDPGKVVESTIPAADGASTSVFTISASDFGNPTEFTIPMVRSLIKSTFSDLLDKPILGAVNARVISDYLGAPSIWHPLKRAVETARSKATTAAEQKQQEESDESDDVAEDLASEEATADVSGLRSSLNEAFDSSIGKSITTLLTGTALYCSIYEETGNLISYNRAAIVLPAAIEAVRLIAIGDQIKSGQDVSSQNVGEAVDTLTDSNGQTIWDAKSLQVTENEPNPSGTDLPTDYYQAFSGSTTANSINSTLSAHNINSVTCSPGATIFQAFVGLIAVLAA